MPDDLTKRGPRDANRVNVNEAWEREYWTEKFGCTDAALRDCVSRVGPMKDDVQRCLAQKQRK